MTDGTSGKDGGETWAGWVWGMLKLTQNRLYRLQLPSEPSPEAARYFSVQQPRHTPEMSFAKLRCRPQRQVSISRRFLPKPTH